MESESIFLPYFTIFYHILPWNPAFLPCEMCSDGLALPPWLPQLQTLESQCALVTSGDTTMKTNQWKKLGEHPGKVTYSGWKKSCTTLNG